MYATLVHISKFKFASNTIYLLCVNSLGMVREKPAQPFEAIINVDTDSDSYTCHSQLSVSKNLDQASHFFLIQLGVSSIF